MKSGHQVLRVLSVIMLACSLLPALAQAQFSQQGPKLVGTEVLRFFSFQGSGVSLSGDGNTAVVGGLDDDNFIGATWVWTRSLGVWTQQAKLVGTDSIGSSEQGYSVAISRDGNTIIVGGPGTQPGAAWVFVRSGNEWIQQSKLGGSVGVSVSLSTDGNTAIVGDPGDDDGMGAARVFERSNSTWVQEAKLVASGATGSYAPNQGSSVALSGDGTIALVGAPSDGDRVGATWVFVHANGVWTQQAKLVGTGAISPQQQQGSAVAISRDGTTVAVGGPTDNSYSGGVWVFARSGGVWSQQGGRLQGHPSIDSPEQGYSVSLSDSGNVLIVGGPGDDYYGGPVGAAWVFKRSGTIWGPGVKLIGTDYVSLFGGVQQGYSVALSGDGNTALVGGPFDDRVIGAAWVFVQPAFAGTPGKANCYGGSVSALAQQYGGLDAAAAALGYSDANVLQVAILAFCKG